MKNWIKITLSVIGAIIGVFLIFSLIITLNVGFYWLYSHYDLIGNIIGISLIILTFGFFGVGIYFIIKEMLDNRNVRRLK